MTEWPVVLFPAVIVALVTRLDAKIVGPYFALSAVIAGSEGVGSRFWYSDGQRRLALARRFAYPFLAGFLLAFVKVTAFIDVAAVGALSAGLLIWPVIFGGLPWYVPRRSWHLPALYTTFIVGCGLASLSGLAAQRLVVSFASGDVAEWLAEQLLSSLLLWVGASVAVLLFRSIFRQTNDEAERRERQGAEGL